MDFEWDKTKNKQNIDKHGLSFELAPLIFGGLYVSREDDRKDYGETRYCAMGTLGPDDRVVIIAYTKRDTKIRIISMRKANRREQNIFIDMIKHHSTGEKI
jgi:uncharacterized DUF497 family protein